MFPTVTRDKMKIFLQVLSLLAIMHVSSSANSAELPKYVGEMQSCKSYAFPGNSIMEFAEWRSEVLMELRATSSDASISREIFERHGKTMKSDLDEYKNMLVWTEKEPAKWAMTYVDYKLATAAARGVNLDRASEFIPLSMDMMNYIIEVWKVIGFLPQENMGCDIDAADTVVATWTPAGWEAKP